MPDKTKSQHLGLVEIFSSESKVWRMKTKYVSKFYISSVFTSDNQCVRKFNILNLLTPPCTMCVQYRRGAQYRGGFSTVEVIMSTVGGYLEYHGGAQHCGGYHF